MTRVVDQEFSLGVRPLRAQDAEAVFEVTAAAEQDDSGRVLIEFDDILSDWARPSYDITAQTTGIFDADRLVAYADVDRQRVEGHVRPGFRGRGFGAALLMWATGKGRELGYERIGQSLPVTNPAAIALFQSFGSQVLYTSWILELPSDAMIADCALPPDHQLRGFDVDQDAEDVYQTIEDAFNEWPNRQASTFEDWLAGTVGRGDFEPWQVIVAVQDVGGSERVVGACKVTATEGEGWIDQIAVRRDSRGHGLGRALLAQAFEVARERGATTCRLNTDSRTGALGLYEHVGMQVVESFEHHAIHLG